MSDVKPSPQEESPKDEQLPQEEEARQEEQHETKESEKTQDGTSASEELAANEEEGEELLVPLPKSEYDKLKEKAEKAEEYLESARKILAEFENYKARVQKEKEREKKILMRELLNGFLPIVDNLERAIAAASSAQKVEDMLEGLKLIEMEIQRFFEQQNVRPIESVGKPFDPHLHEAMGFVEAESQEPGTVVHEYLKGYQWGDFVLRHAKVTVAKEQEKKQEGSSEERESGSEETSSSSS